MLRLSYALSSLRTLSTTQICVGDRDEQQNLRAELTRSSRLTRPPPPLYDPIHVTTGPDNWKLTVHDPCRVNVPVQTPTPWARGKGGARRGTEGEWLWGRRNRPSPPAITTLFRLCVDLCAGYRIRQYNSHLRISCLC